MNTLSFTPEQLKQVMTDSRVFRDMVFDQLIATNKTIKYPNDGITILETYIWRNFSGSERILAIKYVREWTCTNKDKISFYDYERLNSLKGAKDFVDKIIPPTYYRLTFFNY